MLPGRVWGSVRCLAVSPDGRRIASAHVHQICLWDLQTHSNIGRLSFARSKFVHSLAFSPDGNMLTAEFIRGKVCTWDLETMQAIPGSDYFLDFPEPFIYLRVHGEWLFYKDIRIFWLPSDYDARSVTCHSSGVTFCSVYVTYAAPLTSPKHSLTFRVSL